MKFGSAYRTFGLRLYRAIAAISPPAVTRTRWTPVRAISINSVPPATRCAAAFAAAAAPGLNFTRISPATNGPAVAVCADARTVTTTRSVTARRTLLQRTDRRGGDCEQPAH